MSALEAEFDALPEIPASDLPTSVIEEVRESIERYRASGRNLSKITVGIDDGDGSGWRQFGPALPPGSWRCTIDGVRVVRIVRALTTIERVERGIEKGLSEEFGKPVRARIEGDKLVVLLPAEAPRSLAFTVGTREASS